ncbi:MAG: hypothetical protein HOH33_08125 [Verrucomicrobia bacterium]|nr:hypothetical protein [Verrucomicrobiota bacterium]
MQNSFSQMIAWLPEGAVWIIPLSLTFLLAGWISSVVIAVKSKWLALFAVFPLTNPIAVIGLLYKNTTTAMLPVACYTLALMVWFLGSSRSYKIESERLVSYEAFLTEQGEPTSAADYVINPGNPKENAWEHPFLKPLASAGQPDKSGELAREQMDQKYEKLRLPKSQIKVKYEESSTDRLPLSMPSRKLHTQAIDLLIAENPETPKVELPKTSIKAAQVLERLFKDIAPDLNQLKEAVSRKNDIYPFAWEEGFQLLLPHLSKLRTFSQIAQMHSIAQSALTNQEASFESATLAFKLAEIGDTDILISRLVQMAQLTIALDTLVAAQNYHVWNGAQWAEMQNMLNSFDLIQLMPNSLRAERALGKSSLEPMLSQSWSDAMQTISNLDGSGATQMEGFMKSALDLFGSNFSRALLAKHWRLCQEAYSFMIADLEQAAEASKSQPWKDIQVSWADKNLKQYGLFASMLLPALDKAQSKAVLHQTKLELAKTAIDLERYFLKHQQYPETLDSLVPEFTNSTPQDPLTGTSYLYKRLTQDSFEIYSAGLNGKDEGGRNVKKHRKGEVPPPDDLLWVISKESENIPSYTMN